jgi:hypothetical protein
MLEPPTLFEQMLAGEVRAHTILNSPRLQVAAVLDAYPAEYARGIQVIVFPHEPGPRAKWNIDTDMRVAAVCGAIRRRMMAVYSPDLVVEHAEGRKIVNHGHVVLFPSFRQGDSVALHDTARFGRPVDEKRLLEVQDELYFNADNTHSLENRVFVEACAAILANRNLHNN